jgi:hypothetical protein
LLILGNVKRADAMAAFPGGLSDQAAGFSLA